MRKIALGLCIASLAWVSACTGRDSSAPTAPIELKPRNTAQLTACPTTIDPAVVTQLIDDVFGAGSPNANAARGKWDNIQKQRAAGNTTDAQNKTWSLVDFMLDKQKEGKLPVNDAFVQLAKYLFCYAGISAEIPQGSNAWVVFPGDPSQTFVTDDGNAGMQIPAGAVDATSIVSISLTSDTLKTNLDKYNVKYRTTEAPTYEFSKYPSNVFSAEIVVGVCAVAPDNILGRLVLGHNKGTGFEILTKVEVFFLSCTNTASTSTPSLLGTLWAFIGPKVAYAAMRGAVGVGGSVIEFSPIGPVDPKIIVTATAAGADAPIGGAVQPSPKVTLKTDKGRPLGGIPVAFAITSGGGSFSPTSVNSTSSGESSSTWTLGMTPGANTATGTPGAGADAVTGTYFAPTAVSFTSTAMGPASILITASPAGGSYTAGSTLPSTDATVRDATGRTITAYPEPIGLTAAPGPIASGIVSKAAVAGQVSFGDLTITKAGQHTFSLSTTYLGNTITAGPTAAFTIVAGSATQLAFNAGNAQTAPAGSTLGVNAGTVAPSVKVTDAYDNPVVGQTVYWLPGGVSGAITPASPVTNGSGIASATWALLPGANEMNASLSANTLTSGQFFTFTATGTVSTTPFVSCAPGNQRDPIATYAARITGSNTSITDARFYFSVSGNAKDPTPYAMNATARVYANNGALQGTYVSAPSTVYLRGSNSEQKEANFKFTTPVTSGGGTKIVFQITTSTATSNTISMNVGDCAPGSKCSVAPACPAVEVPLSNPLVNTASRQGFALKLFGY